MGEAMVDAVGSAVVVCRWEDLPAEEVRPGVRRRGFGGPNALLVMNELRPGMQLAPHAHEFDQIAYIVGGEAIYHVDSVGHPVRAGSVLFIPAGKLHHIEPIGDETVLNLDVFAPARDDLRHLLDWMGTHIERRRARRVKTCP